MKRKERFARKQAANRMMILADGIEKGILSVDACYDIILNIPARYFPLSIRRLIEAIIKEREEQNGPIT